MLYEDLRQRYGTHIAKRVQHELNRSEFERIVLENLPVHLEERADKMERDYQALMNNPMERGNVRSEILHKRWRDAEDLAYLLSVAEEVSMTVRAAIAQGNK
jgi:hypothetical protein